MLIMTSVMKFPIHEYPYDYWRFTPEAFRSLRKAFAGVYVDTVGEEDFPHLVFAIASDRPFSPSFETRMAAKMVDFKKRWREDPPGLPLTSWRYWARGLMPPLAHRLYRKIRYGE
jgi:hypothetical protein